MGRDWFGQIGAEKHSTKRQLFEQVKPDNAPSSSTKCEGGGRGGGLCHGMLAHWVDEKVAECVEEIIRRRRGQYSGWLGGSGVLAGGAESSTGAGMHRTKRQQIEKLGGVQWTDRETGEAGPTRKKSVEQE